MKSSPPPFTSPISIQLIKLNPHSLILTVLLIAGCARAQVIPARENLPAKSAIAPPLAALPVGEKLTYQISWWGVPVGTVTLKVQEVQVDSSEFGVQSSEEQLIKLTCEGLSNRYLNAFYPVRVQLTSFLDPATSTPRRFEAYVKRRRREHRSTILFDPQKGLAHHDLPKGKKATVPVTPKTQDGVSLIYFARMLDLQIGREAPLEITADGKNWQLTGHVLRRATVKVARLGRFEAVEGDVELAYPVPFFQGAKAWVWFSADGQRLPLLARIHSRVGPVTVVLIEHWTPTE
jgi:hypothetical protein